MGARTQIVEAGWVKLPADVDQVEAWQGMAACPFCGHLCVIEDNDTEVFFRDACCHFDGQSHGDFVFGPGVGVR